MESHYKSKTILFVTGAFITHHCWDEWKQYFEEKGYSTFAPPWPAKNASAKELRKQHPDGKDLAGLSLPKVVDFYTEFAKALPEKPIVIGHALGGLITQILINRDLVTMGIAMHSAPSRGVLPFELSYLKAGWKSLEFFTSLKKTYLMSFQDWQNTFVNGLPPEEQKKSYDAFAIPESKKVIRGGLSSAPRIDYSKYHAPLLFLSGGNDKIIPASLSKRNYKKYHPNGSVLEYKEFPDSNHFVFGLPNWKEKAEYILNWIEKQQ